MRFKNKRITFTNMKTKTVSVRVEEKDRQAWGKAAKGCKNLSAFFVSSVRLAWKYRKLIKLAVEIESGGLSPVKLLEAAAKAELKNMVRK